MYILIGNCNPSSDLPTTENILGLLIYIQIILPISNQSVHAKYVFLYILFLHRYNMIYICYSQYVQVMCKNT